MANRFNRSIREIRDIDKQPLFTNEQNDLLSDVNDDVYVRLRRRYERITGLPELEQKFQMHLLDYNQFKDDTQQMLIFLNDENERQDKMIDKLNTDVDDLNKKAKKLKEITDEHTEQLQSLTNDLNDFKDDVKSNREEITRLLSDLSTTVNEIQQQDDKNKLQSEIDELRKTIETMQSDVDESQTLENLKSFLSVTSNVTENVAGVKDKVYFDVYCLNKLNLKDNKFTLWISQMDVDGNWDFGKEIQQKDLNISEYNNGKYYSISYDISDYDKIVSFKLEYNDETVHIKQEKLSDY